MEEMWYCMDWEQNEKPKICDMYSYTKQHLIDKRPKVNAEDDSEPEEKVVV
jgi:hypothetical protein